jgi:ribosome maturation factor RimP
MAVDESTVRATVEPLAVAAGYDVETVKVNRAGAKSSITVVVDNDTGPTLGDLADFTREVSAAIDADPAYGSQPFNLEITTPGAERPLTEPRHWRRSRGRRAAIELVDGTALLARIGALAGDGSTVTVVVPAERRAAPTLRDIALAEVAKAVVQVEFRPPNPAELELSGLTAGRVRPGEDPGDALDDEAQPDEAIEEGDEDK